MLNSHIHHVYRRTVVKVFRTYQIWVGFGSAGCLHKVDIGLANILFSPEPINETKFSSHVPGFDLELMPSFLISHFG